MIINEFTISATVWLYPGKAGWHFVTLPESEFEQIKRLFGDRKRGWGSLPVVVTLGNTTWKTSIFPDKQSSAFVLPLKAAVRIKQKIAEGDTISLTLTVQPDGDDAGPEAEK